MVVLKEILAGSRDGEWGKGDEFPGSEHMTVIRGTDFEAVRVGKTVDLPRRFIPGGPAQRKRLQPWDIIFETAGGSKNRPTGRSLLLTPRVFARSAQPITCASFARFLRVDQSKAHPPYVFWLLQHLYNNGVLFKFHTQHTGVARFQYTTFAENEELSLPPLPTQRCIAANLSAYDDLIENNTRRIAILEEMARRLYEEWFVHFRVPGHEGVRMVESEIGKVPEGWKVRSLAEVASVNAASIRQGNAPQEIRYIEIKSVSTGRVEDPREMSFTDAPSRARRVVQSGDIIWSTVRPNLRAYALIIDPHPNTIASTGFAVISPRQTPFSFLYPALTTDEFVAYLVNHATGTAYPAVNQKDFEAARLTVPSAVVLENYDRIIQPMLVLAHRLEEKNTNLRAQRDLLLPKLISGEIDVSEVGDPKVGAAAE